MTIKINKVDLAERLLSGRCLACGVAADEHLKEITGLDVCSDCSPCYDLQQWYDLTGQKVNNTDIVGPYDENNNE